MERLEIILGLTRDLGVNLAGVEIILNMREKMEFMQQEFNRFFEYLRDYAAQGSFQDLNATEALSHAQAARQITSANAFFVRSNHQ